MGLLLDNEPGGKWREESSRRDSTTSLLPFSIVFPCRPNARHRERNFQLNINTVDFCVVPWTHLFAKEKLKAFSQADGGQVLRPTPAPIPDT